MANKRMNYFDNMINRFGDNWIVALNSDDIQRSGKRICKELVKGQIDFEKQGNYFLDAKFIDNLIISCENELEINALYLNAVSFYQAYYPGTPQIGSAISHLQILCTVYLTILNKLKAVKQSGNIGFLADTSSMLYSYRNHLN